MLLTRSVLLIPIINLLIVGKSVGALATRQVGKRVADAGGACRGSPPLRQGYTLRALRGLDPLGLRHVFMGRLMKGSAWRTRAARCNP